MTVPDPYLPRFWSFLFTLLMERVTSRTSSESTGTKSLSSVSVWHAISVVATVSVWHVNSLVATTAVVVSCAGFAAVPNLVGTSVVVTSCLGFAVDQKVSVR